MAGRRHRVLLVDTSVWIEVFRKRSGFDLLSVVDLDEIVTCLPIIQEVLQGFDDEKAFQMAREAMNAFPIVESPIQPVIFDEAIALFRKRPPQRLYRPLQHGLSHRRVRYPPSPHGTPQRSRLRFPCHDFTA